MSKEAVRDGTLLATLLASMPAVIWASTGRPKREGMHLAFMSPTVVKFLGYPTERWFDDPAFWYEVIHPDDRERVYSEVASICDARCAGVVRFRWQTSAGAIVWVESYCDVVREVRGTPIGMCGVVVDASERVRLE